jgi:hypothetical protein
MPASYRKAPRALVLARAEESADFRDAQPSDNDFTVLLQRESPRLAVVPSPPREQAAPQPRRLEPRVRPAPPPFPDPDRTAPPTASSVAPPPPTTVSVAAPPPVSSAPQAQRRKQSALVAGALAFVAFGCVAGISVVVALRSGGQSPPPAMAAPLAFAAPAIATPMSTIVAATTPSTAPTPAPAIVAPETQAVGWTADPAPSSTHDPVAIHAGHHHRKHHHTVHAQPLVARAAPPPATSAPVTSPPDAPDPALTDYAPSSTPPVAAAPVGAPGSTPDEMAAAQQMLTQAKAELSL